MSKDYWKEFYQEKRVKSVTPFAKFCKQYIPKRSCILELGCGNGRDSYYLGKIGYVRAIDFACKNTSTKTVKFENKTLNELFKEPPEPQYITYSRFFLHCLTHLKIVKILKRTYSGLFMAEFRVKGDKPVIFKNHWRNFIDGDKFIQLLIEHNFEIIYYKKGRGMAKYKNEDPLVVRVIARKK